MPTARVDGTEEDARIRCLWLQVILRAVEDARGQDMMTETLAETKAVKRLARYWLSHPGFNLWMVCQLANVPYGKLLRKFKDYAKQK